MSEPTFNSLEEQIDYVIKFNETMSARLAAAKIALASHPPAVCETFIVVKLGEKSLNLRHLAKLVDFFYIERLFLTTHKTMVSFVENLRQIVGHVPDPMPAAKRVSKKSSQAGHSEASKLQEKAEYSKLYLKILRTYLESVELFEAGNFSESPIEISIRGKPVERRRTLQKATNIAMLNSMYFYSRHKLELFKDEVRLALGQPPASKAKTNDAEGSTVDKLSVGATGSA
ncbi:hypothetical protein PLEOSDRAFT_166867 [Pleurotus ostreatus PC15]|uniref:Uncharacterized protein n=1 Tax=Pleurotus ostreatus (strain PC15) TaxID=1137138 RepID=A0A067NKT7_PLEO1|nr:hypothetical protein PLEOSDRAFT_166867 [Pleurotus ostreatus PC15]